MINMNDIAPALIRVANAGGAEIMILSIRPSLVSPENLSFVLRVTSDVLSIDWGDGTSNEYSNTSNTEISHTYAEDGEYVITATGKNITQYAQNFYSFMGAITGKAITGILQMNLPKLSNTSGMFCGGENIEANSWNNLKIPHCVTFIGGSMFRNCITFPPFVVPENVKSLAASAFGGCISMTGIVFPPRLERIHEICFSGCNSLVEIIFPASLRQIDNYAFNGAFTSAPVEKKAIFLGTPQNISPSDVFQNNNVDIYVPWSEGEVAGAPWGTSGTITYDYVA